MRLSVGKLCEETEKDKITPHIHCMSENCVPIVILGVRVSGKTTTHIGPTCENQLQVWIFVPMETASGDPTPTTSWDREQNLSDWLKPFTERIRRRRIWIIRECWKPFPKHLLHIFQRDTRTNLEENTNYSPIFRRTPIVILANTTVRAPCRRNPESREDRYCKLQVFGIQLQRIT